MIIGLVNPADDDGKAQPDGQATPHAQAARVDHGSPVWSLAFSAHDAYLASATVTGEVWIKNLVARTADAGRAGADELRPVGRVLT